jgi:hypothetical protein
MTILEQSAQIVPEKRQAVPAGPDNVESREAAIENARTAPVQPKSKVHITRTQARLVGLAFVVGLIVGWIVIGWWLWPVKWNNTEPWLLRPELQKTYVELVAEDYWHTNDLSRARDALAGWDEEALTQILATLQAEASTPEKRQHLTALAQTLALPDPNTSLLTSLLSQGTLVLSVVLSVSPLVAALALGVFPLVKGQTKKPRTLELLGRGVEELEEELDGMLGEDGGQRFREEWQAESEARATGEEQEEGKEHAPEGELEEGGASEEWEEEIGKEDDEAEGDDWLDEEAGEEVGEEGETIADIFADVFQEESETFSDLEALCKDLLDVDIDELAQKSEHTLDQLIKSNWLRQE